MTSQNNVIIDPYDDQLETVKKIFQGGIEVPEFIKCASAINDEERAILPDSAFALILLDNDGQGLRKFACVDKGNTALNVMYLLEHGHQMSKEAQTKAAENLVLACNYFSLSVPDRLVKMSAENKILIKTDGQTPRVTKKRNEKEKIASIMNSPYVFKKDETKFHMRSKLAVDELNLPVVNTPVQTYDQVQHAVQDFGNLTINLHPRAKHKVAISLVKRANDLGIPTPDYLSKYGSENYAESDELEAGLMCRMEHWRTYESPIGETLLSGLLEKKAEIDPHVFAETLAEIDIQTGLEPYWGHGIYDPWYTTFGKIAEEWSWEHGDHSLNANQVRQIAQSDKFKQAFNSDLVNGLVNNTEAVFDSLPLDTKTAMLAMSPANID